AAVRGWRANQKPTSTPPAEPMKKASIDSCSVTHRCFQITPETNQATICRPTSTGLEKKNGGSKIFPNTGYVENTYQIPTNATATRICNARSFTRDMTWPSPRAVE